MNNTKLDKNLVLVISDHPEDLIKEISSFSEPKLTDVVAVCGHVDLPENILAKTVQIPVESGSVVVFCDNRPNRSELSDLEQLSVPGLDMDSLVQFIAEHTQQIIAAQEINVPDIAEFSLKMVEDSCKEVANLSEIFMKKNNDKMYFVPRSERIKMLNGNFSKKSRFNRKILRRGNDSYLNRFFIFILNFSLYKLEIYFIGNQWLLMLFLIVILCTKLSP